MLLKDQAFVVLYIDICHSTTITHKMDSNKRKIYYDVFLNEMTAISNDFGGITFKSMGDELQVLFLKTKGFFRFADNVIACGLMMIEVVKNVVSPFLEYQGLPSLRCRISADYGDASLIKIDGAILSFDYVGNFMNYAGKFIKDADENTMVIGQRLLEVIYTDYKIACKLKGELPINHEQYKYYQLDYWSIHSDSSGLHLEIAHDPLET
jgi:class 3 adenylate cyclase